MFSDNERTSNTALAVVPGEESVAVSRVPARCRQLHCRPGVQKNPVISRVETEGGGVSADNGINGGVLCGPIRFPGQCSAETVCELETRSQRNGNRCPTNIMERVEGICVSTLLPHRQMPEESQGRQGILGAGSPNMEIPALVPGSTGTGDPELLMDPINHPHPLITEGQLRLAAWKLPAIGSKHWEFLEKLPDSRLLNEIVAQTKHIRVPGIAGTWNNKLIPFLALSTPS